jgi:hypothetical protein
VVFYKIMRGFVILRGEGFVIMPKMPGKLVLAAFRHNYYYTSTMGNGQAVRHWVLVPGSGVRIPLPQPSISTLNNCLFDIINL